MKKNGSETRVTFSMHKLKFPSEKQLYNVWNLGGYNA